MNSRRYERVYDMVYAQVFASEWQSRECYDRDTSAAGGLDHYEKTAGEIADKAACAAVVQAKAIASKKGK